MVKRWNSLAFIAVAAALVPVLAQATPITVDGNSSDWAGVSGSYVAYNSAAPEHNFGAPTDETRGVPYTAYITSDATYLYALVEADSSAVGSMWANLYFDLNPSTGSDFGIEVTNNRAFVPSGVPAGYFSLVGTGFSWATNGTTTIEMRLPWTYLMTDPGGMGFPLISGSNPTVQLRLSQSFGYSVAGGPDYGADRLGETSLTAVPEPGTLLMVSSALALLGVGVRRRSA